MAVVGIHIASVRIRQQELHPGQRAAVQTALFLDNEGTGPFVPENQFWGLVGRFNLYGFRFAVQNEALYRGNFTGGHGCTRFQPLHHDFTCGIGVECAIAGADGLSSAVHDFEAYPGQRLIVGALDVLLDREGHFGVIFKNQVVAVAAPGAGV